MKHKVHKMEIDGVMHQVGYKVVTEDFKSTGLRKTPIVQFDESEWNIYEEHGVWAARVPSFATYLRSWMKHRYGKDTKTFIVALKDVQDVRKHGIKAKGILFLKEYEDDKMYDMEKVM